MSDTFTKEVEAELEKLRARGTSRLTLLVRLLWLAAIGMMVTVGLVLNNVALPWLFGLAVVCSLMWVSHAIVLSGTKR